VHAVRKLKPKPSIDDTKRNEDPAKPDVRVRNACTLLVFFEHGVMEKAEEGLDEEADEDDYADNGVSVVELRSS
jgi:hypothetical protein